MLPYDISYAQRGRIRKSDLAALREALNWARAAEGPILLRIRVGTEQPTTDFFLEDPVLLARQFEAWLH